MNRCNISFETLANYIDGTATPAESERIAVHLAGGCTSCQKQVAILRQSQEALRSILSPSDSAPSQDSQEFVRNLPRLRFQSALTTNSRVPFGISIPAITRFVAQLIDQQTLAPTSVRSASDQASLQRLYETDDHLVSLWEESLPGEEGSYIIAQVYSRQESICLIPETVLFVAMSSGITQEAVQEANEFHVPRLLPDNYLIQCWLDDKHVLAMHNVQIGNV